MKLGVWLHGIATGDLHRRISGDWEFRFAPSFLALAEQPVLGRWFEDQDKAALEYRVQRGILPPFFQNYLPEYGPLRELLARRAAVSPTNEGGLLAALGEDLPGAVVVRTTGDDDELFDEPPPRDDGSTATTALRFSLAGVQLKFSVVRAANRLTLPATGMGGRWILKLPDRRNPRLPEHEWSMYHLARAAGITVPDCELVRWREVHGLPSELTFDEEHAFLVRRYDRADDGTRVHQEDFAQVLNRAPSDKYGELHKRQLPSAYQYIGRLIHTVCGQEDFFEYVRRLVFMVLIGNGDAHLKNWSLFYPDRRKPRLAPAYDLVASIVYLPGDDMALRLYKRTRFDEVERRLLARMVEKTDDDPAMVLRVAEETSAKVREAWAREAAHLPIRAEARGVIDKHMAAMRL